MRCPQCHETIPDGVAICPLCDAILNASFLSATTDPGEGQIAPAPPLGSPRLENVDLSGHTEGTSLLAMDPEAQKETRIVSMDDLQSRRAGNAPRDHARSRAGYASSGSPPTASPSVNEVGDLWGKVYLAVRRLRPLEKVVLGLLIGLFVGAFSPWFFVRGEGYVSGIERIGVWTAVATLAAIGVFWVRVVFRQTLLVLLQVALVIVATGVAAFALRSTHRDNPSLGLYATVALGGFAAVTSLIAAVKH